MYANNDKANDPSESSNISAPLTNVLLIEFDPGDWLIEGRGGRSGTGMLLSSKRSGDEPEVFIGLILSKITGDVSDSEVKRCMARAFAALTS